MGVRMSYVHWGNDLPHLDGALGLTVLITINASIPLNSGPSFSGVGVVARWGNDVPLGESQFRLYRVTRTSSELAFAIGNGLNGAFEVLTTNSPIDQATPALYRIAARWRGGRQSDVIVNGVTCPTTAGPLDTSYVPSALIVYPSFGTFGNFKQLRVGQEEDFGFNQQFWLGCYGEFAIYRTAVPNHVITNYMAGHIPTFIANSSVIYQPMTTTADLLNHWPTAYTPQYVVGTNCTLPTPTPPPPLTGIAITKTTTCGEPIIPDPCRRGC